MGERNDGTDRHDDGGVTTKEVKCKRQNEREDNPDQVHRAKLFMNKGRREERGCRLIWKKVKVRRKKWNENRMFGVPPVGPVGVRKWTKWDGRGAPRRAGLINQWEGIGNSRARCLGNAVERGAGGVKDELVHF